ncbi:MAG: hypothetical protein ABFC62_11190 [Clostridiaceae bacterium]
MQSMRFEDLGVISCLNHYKEFELMQKLEKVADIAVKVGAGVKLGEKVLILGDTGSDERVMDLFMYKCQEVGAEVLKMSMHFVEQVTKIPERVGHAMAECDVIFPFTKSQILYSDAILNARKVARILYMGDLETHNMIRPVVLETDFYEMAEVAKKIVPLLKKAHKIEVSNAAGTKAEMIIDPQRRVNSTDSMVREVGELDYLPAGSWSASPFEDSVNGTFVVDGSLYPIGVVSEPVAFHYKDGWIQSIEGGKEAADMRDWMTYREKINNGDKQHYWFSHIGGGINKNAGYTGNLMEDERVWNAFCISGGANAMNFLGKNTAKSHWDGMCDKITMVIDGVPVCEKGKFVHPDLAGFEN